MSFFDDESQYHSEHPNVDPEGDSPKSATSRVKERARRIIESSYKNFTVLGKEKLVIV